MRGELIELHRDLKSTFVFVTHDQIEAMTMATDIVIFNHGRVMQQGTPKEVYENPANLFVATFIGDPRMNTIALPGMGAIGFRPQKARLTKPARFRGIQAAGMIVTKEMLGMDHLYHVAAGCSTIIMKTEDDLNVGESVRLYVSGHDLYYFDSEEQRTRDEAFIESALNRIAAMEGVIVTRKQLAGSAHG